MDTCFILEKYSNLIMDAFTVIGRHSSTAIPAIFCLGPKMFPPTLTCIVPYMLLSPFLLIIGVIVNIVSERDVKRHSKMSAKLATNVHAEKLNTNIG
jgi:sorbitol-specific phosphotransferase system component IIC